MSTPSRNEKLFIPDKQEKLTNGDHIYILADKNHVKRTMSACGYDEKPIKKIIRNIKKIKIQNVMIS